MMMYMKIRKLIPTAIAVLIIGASLLTVGAYLEALEMRD
jgi:hypothetical protein